MRTHHNIIAINTHYSPYIATCVAYLVFLFRNIVIIVVIILHMMTTCLALCCVALLFILHCRIPTVAVAACKAGVASLYIINQSVNAH